MTVSTLDHSKCIQFICYQESPRSCPIFLAEDAKQEILFVHELRVKPHSDDERRDGAWNDGLSLGYDLGLAEGKRIAAESAKEGVAQT